MNVLHHHLESIEAASLRHLDLSAEALGEVLKHDAIGSSEECEHMLDEVLLSIVEFFPILGVLSKIDFFSCPECRLLVLVHLPDVTVLDREKNKSVRVLLEEGLRKRCLGLSVVAVL